MGSQVSFTLSAVDLEAWGDFSVRHSPGARQQTLATSLLVAALVAMVGLFVLGRQPLGVLAALVIAGATFLVAPWVVRRSSRQATRSLYSHGRNVGMLGPRTIRLDHDGVHVDMDGGEETRYWWAVEDVAANATHVFIMVTSVSAHVIPRTAFASPADAEAFYEEARRRHAVAHGRT